MFWEWYSLLYMWQQEQPYYSYRPHLTSTLDRHQYSSSRSAATSAALSGSATTSHTSSMRRMRHLLDLESRHIPNPSPTRTQDPRSRLLDINPAGEFQLESFNRRLPLVVPLEGDTYKMVSWVRITILYT